MTNDFDDLDDLETELGTTLRLALRRVATTVADDDRPFERSASTSSRSSTSESDFDTIDVEKATDQRPSRTRFHLVAAGILAAATVAGIAMAVSRDGGLRPADSANQTVPEASTPPAVQLSEHVLAGLDPVALTLSLPERWGGDEGSVGTEMDGREVYIALWDVTHVYSDPCQWEGTAQEVGPTVEDLTLALEQQPTRNATVTDIEVDGFAGKLVKMSVPDDINFADCYQGEFRSWVGRWHQGPGQRDDVYILDVDGTRVVMNVAYYPDLPQADLDELASIVQSLRITTPAANEAPATTG